MKSLKLCFLLHMPIILATLGLCSCQKFEVAYERREPITQYPLQKIKLYVDNSGSMYGYMYNGSQLKDAVYSYVSAIGNKADTTELYFINNKTIPVALNLQDFVTALSPQIFKTAGGNQTTTDLAKMFEIILEGIEPGSLSVFITDAILDVDGTNPQAFLHNRQTAIRSSFEVKLQRSPDLLTNIVRLESPFYGWYYFSGGKMQLQGESRPYYMFIIGDRMAMHGANRIMKPKSIQHGITADYVYSPYYEAPYKLTNKFGKEIKVNGTELNVSRGDKYVLKASLDLSFTGYNVDDELLNAPELFHTLSEGINIDSISIARTDADYTHKLTISIDAKKKKSGEVTFFLVMPPLPAWLDEVNDETGGAETVNAHTTTGIKNIVQGIAEAYGSTCVNNPAVFAGNKVFTCEMDGVYAPILTSFKFNIK